MKLSLAVLSTLAVAALAAPAPAPRSNTKARVAARRNARLYQKNRGHKSGGSSSGSSTGFPPSFPSASPSGLPSALPSALPSGTPTAGSSSQTSVATALTSSTSAVSQSSGSSDSSSSSGSSSTTDSSSSEDWYNESWAGAVVTGTGMTGVSASFVIPEPKIPTDGQTSATEHTASVWIGMDGYNCDGGLWQAGVDGTTDSQGTTYYAWYEWYPEGTIPIEDLGDLSAGDVITVNLTSSGDYTSGTIVMENTSTGKSFSKTVTDSDALCGTSIDWIIEDLVVDGSENGLANFGTVTFTSATGTDQSGSVSLSDATIMDIEDSDGTPLTQSSTTSDSVVIVYQ